MAYPETIESIGITDFSKWPHCERFAYKPHEFRDYDIDVKIEACGICGSDIHAGRGAWGEPYAPVAVGHEIVGKIVKVGPNAKKGLKVGDRVGIGAQCDSCGQCVRCSEHHENNCKKQVGTYFGTYPTGEHSQGGNASHIRANSKFAFKIPDNLESKHVAPLLCGGITGAAPLFHHGVTKGTKVGVSGIGGIGHMTILFAKALGAEVTAISRSRTKEEDAKKLGADHYIATGEEGAFEKYEDSLDIIINTGSSFSQGSISAVLSLLKARGTMIFITAPPISEKLEVVPFQFLMNNYNIGGSCIGSPEEIEYMLKLASEHDIKPWVETIDINEKNLSEAWKRMEEGDVRYRFTLTGYDKCFK